MSLRRPIRPWMRQLALALAALASWAPAVAAVVDARPAAREVAQVFASHVEETGTTHNLRAHVDHCTLCQLATRNQAERPSTPVLARLTARAPHWLLQAPTPRDRGERWIALSRGPPA